MLVGRERECTHLDELLAQARDGRSAALVVRGEAGIGKSALLSYAERRAGRMGLRATCGVESEVDVAFSSLFDLVRPDLPRIGELPPGQAAAMEAALALGPQSGGGRFAVAAATLSLLAVVAEEHGLLVLVDDAQWLDPPTTQALAFAARRLQAEGVVLIFAVRDGEGSGVDLAGLPELRIEGLGPEAARLVLAARGRPVVPEVADRLVRLTAGNPLALRELPLTLPAEVLGGHAPVQEPLQIGRRLEDVFTRRLDRLPWATRSCLVLVAASGTRSLATVASAVAAAGQDVAALRPAELAGIISVEGDVVEFVHPLMRSVVYQAAPGTQRRRAHQVLADVVSPADVDRRAWHLGRAAAGPDEAIARGLEDAALAARARAGRGAGARAFERAAQLTPNPEERCRRLIEAARDYQLSGEVESSSPLIDQALAESDDPDLRAEAGLLLARLLVWRGEPTLAYSSLRAQADALRTVRSTRACALLTDAAIVATMRGDYRAQVASAEAAVAAARRSGSETGLAQAEVVLAHGLVNIGHGGEGVAILLRRDVRVDTATRPEDAPLLQLAGFAWMCVEENARARQHLDVAIGSLRQAGAFGSLPFLLASRSMLDHRTGRWAAACAGASEAVRLAQDCGHDSELPFYLVCLAAIEASQGRDEDSRGHLDTAAGLVERYGVDSVLPWMEAARGALELGQGRYDEAIVVLQRIPELVRRMAIGQPTLVPWLPDLVEAYFRAGRLSSAERALGELERQAEASGRIWAHATAARCRGMLCPTGVADRQFHAALRWHEQIVAPFDLARTQLCFGERLGLEGRREQARDLLHSAFDTFERLGATAWTERAGERLMSSGARRRRRTDPRLARLTSQELQVAYAIQDGATNKEAAAALFLSTRTIEFHLGNAYRKLGLRSRTQLARLLND